MPPSVSAIDSLVDAALPEFEKPLSILLVSNGHFPKFNILGKEEFCVIEAVGKTESAKEAILLAKNRLPKKINMQYADQLRHLGSVIEDSKSEVSLNKMVSKLRREDIVPPEIISRSAVSQALSLADPVLAQGLAAELMQDAIEKYRMQSQVLRNKELLKTLSASKFKILEHRLQISACPKCHNLEFVASAHPLKQHVCAECNRKDITLKIYALNQSYSIHKSRNKDLPLFICEYLRRKLPNQRVTSSKPIEVEIDGSIEKGDIDVCVEQKHVGIESKLFLNPTPIGDQLRNYTDEVLKDLKKYVHAGIRTLMAVTNLSEKDAKLLLEAVRLGLAKEGLEYDRLDVLPGSMVQLLRRLDELSM